MSWNLNIYISGFDFVHTSLTLSFFYGGETEKLKTKQQNRLVEEIWIVDRNIFFSHSHVKHFHSMKFVPL